MLALVAQRGWDPPIVLTEALARRGRRRAAGGRSRLTGRASPPARSLEQRAVDENRASGGRSTIAAARARRHLENAVSRDPELSRLLEQVQDRELDPLTRRARDSREGVPAWRPGPAPTLADIQAARERIAGHARVTPVYGSDSLSRVTGRTVLLKAENLQRTGSFKIRGAVNLLGVAHRGRARGRRRRSERRQPRPGGRLGRPRARRPRDDLHAGGRADGEGRADAELRRRCRARGRRLRRGARRRAARGSTQTGATFIHAFEDERVIAGQGTIGLELAEQIPRRSTRFSFPSAAAGLRQGSRSRCGRCSRACESSASRSTAAAHTIADGIAVKHPGELTMSILGRAARRSRRSERRGRSARRSPSCSSARSSLVEGAGAVGVAALLAGKAGGSGSVCALLSGGNIDPTTLISVHAPRPDGRRALSRDAHAS